MERDLVADAAVGPPSPPPRRETVPPPLVGLVGDGAEEGDLPPPLLPRRSLPFFPISLPSLCSPRWPTCPRRAPNLGPAHQTIKPN